MFTAHQWVANQSSLSSCHHCGENGYGLITTTSIPLLNTNDEMWHCLSEDVLHMFIASLAVHQDKSEVCHQAK